MAEVKSAVYTGAHRGPLRNGHGTYNYGYFKYVGDWVDGVKHGYGILLMGDGGSFEGNFVRGEIEGQGTRRWCDGSTYNGEFHRGERHGKGYE